MLGLTETNSYLLSPEIEQRLKRMHTYTLYVRYMNQQKKNNNEPTTTPAYLFRIGKLVNGEKNL